MLIKPEASTRPPVVTREIARAPLATGSDIEPDPAGYTALFSVIDRELRANAARYTMGLSPWAMSSAWWDWLGGLAFSPGRQAQLLSKAQRKYLRLMAYARACMARQGPEPCITPLPQDKRFDDPAWQEPPFNLIYQSFLLTQQWWHNATTGVRGVTPESERAVEFAARQWLDLFSPSNFPWTNPVVLEETRRRGGQNLLEGAALFVEDMQARIAGRAPERGAFRVGEDIAATPGKVIYRNRLIELIQYAPATETVRAEPVLIVPAWIMKYYVLDLSAHNSLVRHLVGLGHTVFMISWKNPDEADRDLGMDDYRRLGPMAALDCIGCVCPGARVHGVGYCIGGTLLAIAAAAMARDNDERFASLTFLATQIDFEEAGELMLFINDKQIAFLEDLMWEQGFLDSRQMAGAFQMLRSSDLIWSRMVREYLMGKRLPVTDLMAWNADGTRMPARMHSEYLKQLFLHNDLAEGRYKVDGAPVSLGDIRAPLFVVGAETDHVAPWRSVFKWRLFAEGDLTFVLTNGGHNAGIIADPAETWRSYRVSERAEGEHYVDPEVWAARADVKPGSWWSEWGAWLDRQSGVAVAPPPMGAPGAELLGDAPGDYVHTA